jgi:fatty-acyl-CoA synthase
VELHVPGLLEALERTDPDHPAIVHRGLTRTRRQFGDRSRRLANVIVAAGLGRSGGFDRVERWNSAHDHVALLMHNGPEYLESMVAAWSAGAVPVNVNYRYVADELQYLLQDASARAVVVHSRYAPTLGPVLERLAQPPGLVLQVPDGSESPLLPGAHWYDTALDGATGSLPEPVRSAWSGDDLYLCYTGGTTGRPKGVAWRQADFLVAALGIRRRDGGEFDSFEELAAAAPGRLRALPAPPFMHGAAHWNALACWGSGGTVVIQDRGDRADPADLVTVAEREQVSSLLLVGDPMAVPLVDELRRTGAELPALRHLISGGAVLSAATRAALLELLPGLTIVDVLGSTEAGRQAVATVDRSGPADTAFVPSTGTVVVDDERTARVPRDSAEEGWLARTGRVPLGYLGDPDGTARTFPMIEGVRHAVPGDRARWNADGSVTLLGRDSVCINTGGEKVFVEEVEQAVRLHPDVADVVVCGRPSPRWGEEVVAIVRLRPGRTPGDAELRDAAAGSIAGYKLPKAFLRVDEVVRSPSGKADYRWARAVAERDDVSPSSPPRSG